MQIKIIVSLILLASAGGASRSCSKCGHGGRNGRVGRIGQQKAHAAAIANCEAMWDSASQMTKTEWSRTCRRVQNRLRKLELR
jgi:hypothetical protein